jgi:hypothetical protein
MGFTKYTQSGDSLFYGGGPRWTPMAAHLWSPFAEFLFGGRKVTYEVDNPELENKLLSEWNDGSATLPHYPSAVTGSTEVASNGPSLAAGGGVDVVITRSFAWRHVNIQYIHSWMAAWTTFISITVSALPLKRCCASGRGRCGGVLRAATKLTRRPT